MPFVRLAYTDNQGAARNVSSTGEYINHFNAVRIRVNGTGSLLMKLYSLDDVKWRSLKDIKMSLGSGRLETSLTNLSTERASLELRTTTINDYFKINRVLIFSKFLYTSHPNI